VASYQRVLVGTDGSETSFRAVDRAAAIAREAGAQLVIASAYRPMSARERQEAADQLGSESYKVSGATPAEEVLRAAGERACRDGAVNVEGIAEEGDPVEVLVRVAEQRKVDLIVVGNRGLNSLTGRLLGSVPSVVAHRSPVDVLIVHTT
jgi:nucleotide-binding universal stress UspA family protein